ncbi:hypothetical protein [Butyrivibrio sp. VCD2006]|uniref:hypothetical protein n=1 Tax=Butyrivibrio sp. VCD2006 TaxID=1280664 RepID=UPI0004056C7E|nr:hypothetical protein [Butyrivibrio sp. VCD2006]
MAGNKYSTIFIRFGGADRDILMTQVMMMKERFKSFVVLMVENDQDKKTLDANSKLFDDSISIADEDISDAALEYCSEMNRSKQDATFVGILSDNGKKLKDAGFSVKNPGEMAESYKKAMEMLENMVVNPK